MTTVNLIGLPTSLINMVIPADAPIIVAMHGIGSNETDLVPAYRAFEQQAVLAFPRSPLAHPPGNAWYPLSRLTLDASFQATDRALGRWPGL